MVYEEQPSVLRVKVMSAAEALNAFSSFHFHASALCLLGESFFTVRWLPFANQRRKLFIQRLSRYKFNSIKIKGVLITSKFQQRILKSIIYYSEGIFKFY